MNNKPTSHPLKRVALAASAALAVLAGCSSIPADNAMLEQARSDYRAVQNTPQASELAGVELKQASDALTLAGAAQARNDKRAEVDHLAYLAKQRIAIAQQTVQQKSAEQAAAQATIARDKLRLTARTDEADTAKRVAQTATSQAEMAQSQAAAAQQQAASSQQQAQMSQQQAAEAQMRASQLEAQLNDMNAKKTERGMVITMGDVLFDTNKSQLKSGAMRNVDKLAAFLKQYPQRKLMVEGFTDSVGSEASNQDLSSRRADAVRAALVQQGVAMERIATRGYGEANPVASNDNNEGRQLNRRVEIVLSDDKGAMASR